MIEVRGLTQTFRTRTGPVDAVKGIDFEVRDGEILGLLGPNGAGKTTTLRMLCTLLKPTAGSAVVAGIDVSGDAREVRRRIGYVAQVGSRATPLVFRIVSLWSALEGSILFWGLILGSYTLAFALSYKNEVARFVPYALGTLLGVGTFFAFLIAGPATPFRVLNPAPMDGPGPNPLLQNHILMVIHPPILYLGYVGMTVPFAVAVGALVSGEIAEKWMAPLRRWTMLGWIFLSCGILIGGRWAYAVLGWGGY